MGQFDLRAAFTGLQREATDLLRANRTLTTHAPTKGRVTEKYWQHWLQRYLPKRYCVGEAIVVDCDGHCSEQLDLVIYDRQYSPFAWHVHGAKYILAESVYAVFEVKQTLDKATVEYAGQKIQSVRQLNRARAPIDQAGGNCCQPAPPLPILGGILTLDSSWSDAFGEPFATAVRALEPLCRLNLGCVLDCGAFTLTYDAAGGCARELSVADEALIYFFLKLLSQLQRLGTVSAIDLEQYARVLSPPGSRAV